MNNNTWAFFAAVIFVITGCSSDITGPNRAPVANAGPDRVGNINKSIELEGSASYDPDGDEITHTWTLLAAPAGAGDVLANADDESCTFTPDEPGIWLISLVVDDGRLESEPDVVRARVLDACDADEDCDDDDVCNGEEYCEDNTCKPGNPLDCDDEDPCTDDMCDAVNGCYPVFNTDPCDDGDDCTMNDTCSEGVCLGEPLDADGDGFVSDECGGDDCDDSRNDVGPGVFEGPWDHAWCNDGLDNDCDGLTDDEDIGCRPCEDDSDCDDNNVCNGIERCQSGGCRPGTFLQCADSNPCTDDGCDPETGCTHEYNTEPCDDGDPCTIHDTCDTGACVGEAKVSVPFEEGGCDDGNDCTDDACESSDGSCSHQNNTDSCDDGNPCTINDVCDGEGNCSGVDKTTVREMNGGCDDGNLCTDDSCNLGDGSCGHAFNELPCNDGSLCTIQDTCVSGMCVGQNKVDVSEQDGGCDDGNECTDDTCNPVDGECGHPFNSDPCDDGDPCTINDTCDGAGSCIGTDKATAPQAVGGCNDGNVCTNDACNPGDGSCEYTDNNGVVCNMGGCDGICQDGQCSGCVCETAADCDDGNDCTIDECIDDVCQWSFADDQTACDDGVPCTIADTCNGAGVCIGVNKVDLPTGEGGCDDGNECTDDSCEAASGDCQYQNNTDPCDDDDPCTLYDNCDGNGSCVGVPKVDVTVQNGGCDDGNECTDDSCNSGDGSCGHVNNNDPCDDGDLCTVQDFCSSGTCQGVPKVDVPLGEGGCDDGNECTDDSCNSGDGSCGHQNNTDPCNDGDLCTINDTCDGTGSCVGVDKTTVPEINGGCDDENECTADACIETDGSCDYTILDIDCDDDNLCTLNDHCDEGGNCVGQDKTTIPEPEGCDDGNVCTDDSCVPADGSCDYANNTALCDDDDPCTIKDTCSGGICLGEEKTGIPVGEGGCDDLDVCTTDTCEAATGNCLYENNTGPCDDAIACTDSDTCVDGECVGTPDDEYCDANNAGDICWPECSPNADGCLTPPGTMNVNCEDPVDLPDDDSICNITLTGGTVTDQLPCLSCRAEVGITVLDYTDFADDAGDCDPDGWELVPTSGGDFCSNDINGCSPGGSEACASVFENICETTTFGQPVMRADQALTDSGHEEQWRLFKSFDASGLTDLQVCFDYAENNANNDEGILVYVWDTANGWYQIFCQLNGPRGNVEQVFYRYCASVPSDYDGSTDLMVTFVMHSNNDHEQVFLDNVEVYGWSEECAPNMVPAFEDDFSDCALPKWSSVTGNPTCPGEQQCGGGNELWTNNDTWTIEKTDIDATALDDHVRLCFDLGEDRANGVEEFIHVEFFNGSIWQDAWYLDTQFGQDNDCARVCTDLSALDPAVNNNPSLGIRFTLGSNNPNEDVWIDNVILEGAENCEVGEGVIELSDLEDLGSGDYRTIATDVQAKQLTSKIECVWDLVGAPVGADGIWFRP